MNAHKRNRWEALARGIFALAAALAIALVAVFSQSAAQAAPNIGDQVYIGTPVYGESGTMMFPIWFNGTGVGEPDTWAYCIEHDVTAPNRMPGMVWPIGDYLGENLFQDPAVQGKVFWVMAHSYPALSLAELAANVGLDSITEAEAIEATTYAIWRYTDVGWDAPWYFTGGDDGNVYAAYWWLVNNANAATTTAPGASTPVTAAITAPSGTFSAGDLVGPFTVNTSEAAAQVTIDPSFAVVDSGGNAIDLAAVVDGQQLYIDTTGATSAGSATLTVTATASQATNMIISVPLVPGEQPTAESHWQSIALVMPFPASAAGNASGTWNAASDTDDNDDDTDPGTEPAGEELAATGSTQSRDAALLGFATLAAGIMLLVWRRRVA